MNSLFSTHGGQAGELNANSLTDALQVISKYASAMEHNLPSNVALTGQPTYNDEQRDELISRAIMTHEGKLALAQAMANPIRRNLDYHGIARRALVVDPLMVAALAA